MTHLHLRHRTERGAAVFIVVMVIALLTGIGIYAARSASLVDVAAGYNRQALQAQHVSEFGALLAIAEAGTPAISEYIRLGTAGSSQCRMNRNISASVNAHPFCFKLHRAELESRLVNTDLFEPPSDGNPGSLGMHADLQGNFAVELTDIGPAGAPVQGTEQGGLSQGFTYYQVALTSIGQVVPSSNLAACTEKAASLAGQQMMRAHVVVGPIAK